VRHGCQRQRGLEITTLVGAERIWREAKGIPTPVLVAGSRTASIASGP